MDDLRVEVDRLKLDEEWAGHSEQVVEWGEKLADAIEAHDTAKSNFDIKKAELGKKIREEPGEYGITKATEAAVADAVLCEDEYKTAREEVIAARYDVGIAEAAVNGLEHRKRALTKLTELWEKQYFSSLTAAPPTTQKEGDEYRSRPERSTGRKRKMTSDG